MKRRLSILRNLLYCPGWLLAILIPASAAALMVIFTQGYEDAAPAAAAYTVSAYTTIALVPRCITLFRSGRAWLHRHPQLHRYLTDLEFRARASLYLSLCINLFYSVYKAAIGIRFHSAWFGSMAAYYILLGTERFLLLRGLRTAQQSRLLSLRKYRFCGFLLLILTFAIMGMGFYTVFGEEAVRYPGYMIYAAAGYTFYNFGSSISNLLRYRKLKNPIYTASKVLALAAALVSVFFLQTAMFAAFGGTGAWQRRMNLATGFGVLASVTAMALVMIFQSSRSIAVLSKPESGLDGTAVSLHAADLP